MVEGSTEIITGTLGAGKSLCGADKGMDALVEGCVVITNLEYYPDKIAEWMRIEYGLIFDSARLIILKRASIADFQNFAMRGNEKRTVTMILDEAALDIGARDWQKHSDEQFNFVILCRKLGIHLVLIAQDANDIDKRIRAKMQREVHCRSLNKLPFLDGVLKMPIFIRVTYSIELGKRPMRLGAKFYWKAKSWGMYNTKTLHGAKAQLFEALDQAPENDLERVQYSVWPYMLAGATTFISSLIVVCLFGNF